MVGRQPIVVGEVVIHDPLRLELLQEEGIDTVDLLATACKIVRETNMRLDKSRSFRELRHAEPEHNHNEEPEPNRAGAQQMSRNP